jgi:hypothetical protein
VNFCQVTDLGAVLHMVGGTAASYMIFFLPGLLLINAAIVKRTASLANLAEEGEVGRLSLIILSELVNTPYLYMHAR